MRDAQLATVPPKRQGTYAKKGDSGIFRILVLRRANVLR